MTIAAKQSLARLHTFVARSRLGALEHDPVLAAGQDLGDQFGTVSIPR